MSIYPKDSKPARLLYCRTIHITKIRNQSRWPWADEWIKRTWHMNAILLFSHTKEHDSAVCRGINGAGWHYVKWNVRRVEDNCHVFSLPWEARKLLSKKQRLRLWYLETEKSARKGRMERGLQAAVWEGEELPTFYVAPEESSGTVMNRIRVPKRKIFLKIFPAQRK